MYVTLGLLTGKNTGMSMVVQLLLTSTRRDNKLFSIGVKSHHAGVATKILFFLVKQQNNDEILADHSSNFSYETIELYKNQIFE